MTGTGRPWLWVSVDDARGVALVRGVEAKRACELLSPTRPRYSGAGRGWVVPAAVVDDLTAYAQVLHRFIVVGR